MQTFGLVYEQRTSHADPGTEGPARTTNEPGPGSRAGPDQTGLKQNGERSEKGPVPDEDEPRAECLVNTLQSLPEPAAKQIIK